MSVENQMDAVKQNTALQTSYSTRKLSALDLSESDWKEFLRSRDVPAFRAGQILNWIFVKENLNPLEFSNLPPSLRTDLSELFDWQLPQADTVLKSTDGSEKCLLKLHDGRLIECVIMPSENRVTLCVSSQVGCAMGCTFCQTGRMGLMRNLTSGEILGQILFANKLSELKVTNVVFMGMGEPLDNFDHVVEACQKMTSPKLLNLSKHRVTVSTSGLVPQIEKLGQTVAVSLAISLHSASDADRSAMMPVNRKYPLDVLKKALLEYPINTRHGITFEYVMIAGKNDSIADAKKLVKFVHGLKAKVNLIPLNAHPGNPMVASDAERLREFQSYLADRSIPAPVRYSRGQDVSGACGQLVNKRENELLETPRKVALARQREFKAQTNS
jgi:23S rRNA (adenine2503-C2)-methyltransferase